MLSSGSCDSLGQALESLVAQRLREAAKRLPLEPGEELDLEGLKGVARDFAEFLYAALFKQMQKTVRDEGADAEDAEDEDDEGPVREGVLDFVAMYLPQAVAGDPEDAVARYIYEQMRAQYGDGLDERA